MAHPARRDRGHHDFIDARYNFRRLHSTLNHRTPAGIELEYRQQQLAAA